MKAAVLTVLASVCVVGCAPQRPGPRVPFSEIVNVRIARLHKTPSVCLFALNKDAWLYSEGVLWGLLDEDKRMTFLKNVPNVSLAAVDQISVSPDDRYLAVISVGEGHPLLDVFELSSVLESRDAQDKEERIEPIASIDPYPDGIEIVGWSGEQIVLESGVDLERLDKKARRVTPLPDQPGNAVSRFVWDIGTDVLRRK